MDQERFDRMSRALASSTSRRAGLRALVGLASVVAAASMVDGTSAARLVCRRLDASCSRGSQCCTGQCGSAAPHARRGRNRCSCAGGLTNCGGNCVNTAIDLDNCGACRNHCESETAVCFSGECCIPNCEGRCAGDDGCGGVCPDLCADGTACCANLGICTRLDCVGTQFRRCVKLAGGCVLEHNPGDPVAENRLFIQDSCVTDADCLDNILWANSTPFIGCAQQFYEEGSDLTQYFTGLCFSY
jgi:hypothetical protein